jgi:endonuclease/exonuclease/phosphatase (EEP) superfamily protein YafD
MDLPRTRQFGRWFWRHLHREAESYWWLTPVLLGWAGLLAAAVGVLCHQLAISWQPAIVLAALAHQLMWGGVLALVVFAAARRWWALFFALVVLSGVVATQADLYESTVPPASGASLTVLQANLRIGNANPADLVEVVRHDDVDLATTEELTVEERADLIRAGLAKQLPYFFGYTEPVPQGDHGLGIWSRYPLTVKVEHPGYQLGVLSVELNTPIGALTLFAVHLRQPFPYPSSEWIREIGRLRTLLAAADTNGQSVIVAGDFNSTVDNANLSPTHLKTVALPGSDHRGLLATLRA